MYPYIKTFRNDHKDGLQIKMETSNQIQKNKRLGFKHGHSNDQKFYK